MFIKTEPTPNIDSLKFKPGVPVLTTGGTFEFRTASEAKKSPLV